jgi:hypothetical protein
MRLNRSMWIPFLGPCRSGSGPTVTCRAPCALVSRRRAAWCRFRSEVAATPRAMVDAVIEERWLEQTVGE